MSYISLCEDCKHQHANGQNCDAFPEGIPREIIKMYVSHTKPYLGDKGIQFDPREESAAHVD